jgi:protein-disulfide isomerase
MPANRDPRPYRLLLPLALLALAGAGSVHLLRSTPAQAEEERDPSVLAEVGSVAITEEQVEATVLGELQRLERERQELIERGMEAAIQRELVNQEAAARGVEPEALLQELYSDLPQPTKEEIDAFYESRKAQINRPQEEVQEQIVSYLSQQSRQQTYETFLKELRGRYEVRRFLEPMRIEIAAADAPALGPASAPVTIIEFSDFQCPYCQRMVPTLEQVVANYGDRVRLVFRQFPLPIHADAQKAAEASLCAADSGKFWEMHDKMFEDIRALSVDQLKQAAVSLGLDGEAFAQCLDSGKHADRVADDLEAGRLAGVTGTPAMFVNGRFVNGAVPYDQLAALIDDELERESRQ